MAKKKEHTPQERAAYERQQFQQAKNQIEDALAQYKEHPEQIAEMLAFKSRFYQYSMNNTLLIEKQNRGATYVGSFQKWKELGYSVKLGQHGIKVLVPVETTTFKVTENGQEHIRQLRDATPEEKAAIKAGKIETHKRRGYRIGNVFDIAQTNCPPEDYPKIFHQGYSSAQHTALYDAVKAFSASQKIPVTEGDVQSIALRGYFNPEANSIKISDKLTDTEKLSTLTHELGHALMYQQNASEANLPSDVRELEADSFSIMLQSHFGLQLTQSRIDHLKNEYELCAKIEKFSFEDMLKDVNSAYLAARKALEPFLQKIPEIKEQPQQANEKPAAAAFIAADMQPAPAPWASYTIYQLKSGPEYRDYRWQALNTLSKAGLGVRQQNYDAVFSAPLAKDDTLDSLYEKFNLNPPAGFRGHSLSMSDVVVLEQNGKETANYVDRLGFQETPEFFAKTPSKSFAEQVDTVLQGKGSPNADLYVCDTPKVLTDLGLKQLPMFMTQKHLKDVVHEKDEQNRHWHGIDVNQVKSLQHLISEPAMVLKSLTKANDVVIVTTEHDSDNLPIVVPIHPDGKGRYEIEQVNSNFITSVYGREGFIAADEKGQLSPDCFLGRVFQSNGLLFADKEKSQQLVGEAKLRLLSASTSADFSSQPSAGEAGLELPSTFTDSDSIFTSIISNNGEKVNQNAKKSAENSKPDKLKKLLHLSKHEMESRHMSGHDFSGQDLHGIDLSGWSINDCSLDNCNLQNANLTACTLGFCTMQLSNLDGADLTQATLKMDNLQGCNINNTVFAETALEGSHFDYISGIPRVLQVTPHMGAATDDEIAQYVQHVNSAFEAAKYPEQVEKSRQQWAHDWLLKVKSGAADRTKSFQRLEPVLQELDKAYRPTFPAPSEGSPDAVKKFLRGRAIGSAVISDCINRGLLYQDGKQAAVFSSSDKKCAIQQATVAGATGMKEIAAEDGAHGWYVDNGAEKLYVARSPVQVLEEMTRSDRNGADISGTDYLAIGNADVDALVQIVQAHPHIKEVVVEAGVTGQALNNACPGICIRQRSQLSQKNKSKVQPVQEDTAPAV